MALARLAIFGGGVVGVRDAEAVEGVDVEEEYWSR